MAGFGQTLGALGVQAGLGIIGNKIAQQPVNQMNAWQRLQYENELRRRNAMQAMAMPSMLRGLGYSEDQARAMAGQFQAQQDQGQSQSSMGQPSGGGSKLGTAMNVGGLASTGLGIASKLGAFGAGAAHAAPAISGSAAAANAAASGGVTLGSGGMAAGGGIGSTLAGLATNPFTIAGAGLLGAGLIAKHYIGQGRKAANNFVQDVENPFGQQLQQISQMAGTNPAQAKQVLMQAEATYRQQAQAAMAQGGNDAKVAQQSLNNQGLQGTVQRLKQQLGMA